MRLPSLIVIFGLLAMAPVAADDHVDACALAAAAFGAAINPAAAVQRDKTISFEVPPNVNQATGITCVFAEGDGVPQLAELYWRFGANDTGAIDVAPINAVLAARFSQPDAADAVQALSTYDANNQAELAFTCAAWANVDDGRSIALSEIERLTLYGYDLGLAAAAIFKLPETIAGEAKLAGLYQRAPLDFWVGTQWVQANEAVNRGLDANVPQANQPYEEWLKARAVNASANFAAQGCAALGG
ncbi:MAG: hypothetical protein JWP26_2937 [Devosia sp.]|uniref:hypothetical protein n=1 Tax=Devosia sp. TaxID=1871048 RepID=UPI0026365EE6|nr:hypothetical protein [Devosia sp.]MDB5587967.1 hypothetical protein [Devosia sp.]